MECIKIYKNIRTNSKTGKPFTSYTTKIKDNYYNVYNLDKYDLTTVSFPCLVYFERESVNVVGYKLYFNGKATIKSCVKDAVNALFDYEIE